MLHQETLYLAPDHFGRSPSRRGDLLIRAPFGKELRHLLLISSQRCSRRSPLVHVSSMAANRQLEEASARRSALGTDQPGLRCRLRGYGWTVIPWTILYDDDCGFCRWSVDVVLRLDRSERLDAVSIQSARGQELLRSIPPSERLMSWHLRAPSGAITSAGAAIAPLLRLLPFGAMPAAIVAHLPRATERGYGWVARHRTLLGTLVGRTACSVDPALRR
jgi:predicted DCC family thiol-disulfide oxidoreductase YuxK